MRGDRGEIPAPAALTLLGIVKFDVALVDFRLAGINGSDLPSAAKRAQPGINIILTVEGIGNAPSAQPPAIARISPADQTAENRRIDPGSRSPAGGSRPAARSNRHPVPWNWLRRKTSPALVGASEKMKKIYRLISKVALQRHPVLIMGESGTGKELVARAIHTHGPWRDKPFVPVDCGALPPTLIESELFGHVKGAFTGAAQSRQGLLAAAGSGTVFLDEIGELPIELQSRLLRALQEHEIRPLGSNERIKFEARIIAATNQDLEAGIKRNAFRKDLFFRLNVVTIKMPSFATERKIFRLWCGISLQRFDNRKPPTHISDEALGRLMSYDWPGNIRELENCIQRAVSLGSGTFVQIQDLPSAMLYQLARNSSTHQDPGTLQTLEQQAIRQALQATGGDRVRAAKLLGIGKTTIYRKLKEYGIETTPTEA